MDQRIHEVNRVDPLHVSLMYINTIGVIARLVININEDNRRGPDHYDLQRQLLERLHQRFKFPQVYRNIEYMTNVVNKHTILKFLRSLSN